MSKIKNILIPGLAAGFGMLGASFGFNFLTNFLFPDLASEYLNPALFRPWSDPLMQLFFAYPFILGLSLAFVWNKINSTIPGRTVFSKGLSFGLGVFLVSTIPGMFVTYTSFQVSPAMVLSWTVSGLLTSVIAGWILAKFNKRHN